MNEHQLQALLDGVQAFSEEIKLREQSLRKPVIADLFPVLVSVLNGNNFKGIWTKQVNQDFHDAIVELDIDGKTINTPQDLFRIEVGLCHILKHLKKTLNLSISYWPKVNLYPRQHLALNKNKQDIMHIDEFHALLRVLISKGSNLGTPSTVLCSRLVLGMIALDGISVGLADRKIAFLTVESIHLGDRPFIGIKTGRLLSTTKQYSIGTYTVCCLKYLLRRAKVDGTFFPPSWTKKGHKKTARRQCLEDMLSVLWREAYPDRAEPKWLDVNFWISASRQSMEILGIPYMCIATLSNEIRGAQLPIIGNTYVRSQVDGCFPDEPEVENEKQYLLLDKFITNIKAWDQKTHISKVKISLGEMFKENLRDWLGCEQPNENEWEIGKWLIWMLGQNEFSKMRISTFEGYIYTIKCRVMPLLCDDFLSLNQLEWETLVEEVAKNQDYMPSSRRQAITHLERFHGFLRAHNVGVPEINFRSYRYRIYREYAECDIIFPHEVDQVLARFYPGSGIWLGILFGFYCGLRCEELCYLRVSDLADEYRLVIGRSKIKTSLRTLPYGLLIPPNHMTELRKVLAERISNGEDWLVCDSGSLPIDTGTLSKRVGRALKRHECRVQKMHALRHGFASWQLVRYFMLVDDQFRKDVAEGVFHIEIDANHPWFSKNMLGWFAELLGGVSWVQNLSESHCHATSTDMIIISKLLGHVNRFTTLENYSNSLGWITRYYLNRRSGLISG